MSWKLLISAGKDSAISFDVLMSRAKATVRRIGSASSSKPPFLPCNSPDRLAKPFHAPIIADASVRLISWRPVRAITSAAADSSTVITNTL